MSRPMTKEEMLRAFVDHAMVLPEYWARTRLGPECSKMVAEAGGEMQYRLEGLLHSLFVVLDGCAGDLPAFDLVPQPHPEDKAFHRTEGTDWWSSIAINDDCHLKDFLSAAWRQRGGR